MKNKFLPGQMMDYPLTLDRILEHANRLFPHKRITTKLADGSFHQYTYSDLYKRVKRLGNVLVSLGIKPGDRVATFSWNNYQHLELYYAVPGAAAVCHTLNIRLSGDQLAYIINHAGDKLIFVDASLLPQMESIAPEIKSVRNFVVFNTPAGSKPKLPNVLFYEDLLSRANEDFEWLSTDESMAMGLCYTSGTTGNPKGVLYSHRSMFLHTYMVNQASSVGLLPSDVVLPVVPQFHAQAWGLPYACAMAGAEIVLPGQHLNPAALAEMLEEKNVTMTSGVPTIWQGLYYELKTRPRNLSKLRLLMVGGSAIPRALVESYEKDFKINILQGWGMTEMSPVGTICRLQNQHSLLPDHEKWDIKATQGYPLAGVELRIVNEAGEELPWDGASVGELQVRGAWVVKSYFRQMPGTEAEHFTKDGWFRTGDVACLSSDGYLKITDRTKDLIKSGGEWISSVELENALVAHPKVKEAAVIAIPHEKWHERPLAVIIAESQEAMPEETELIEYLAQKFAKLWLPEKFVFVREIPKTGVGKIDKKVLRQRYHEGVLI